MVFKTGMRSLCMLAFGLNLEATPCLAQPHNVMPADAAAATTAGAPTATPTAPSSNSASAEEAAKTALKYFYEVASSLYNERTRQYALGGGDYAIDYEWVEEDDLKAPPYWQVQPLQDPDDILAALQRCVFPMKVGNGSKRLHKHEEDLVAYARSFSKILQHQAPLYEYFLLENWETESDNWEFASCGLGIRTKNPAAQEIILGLQAVKI